MVQVVQPVQQANLGTALLQGLQAYQGVKGIQAQEKAQERQQEYDDIQDAERFKKESSQFAASVAGMTPEQKVQAIQNRISDLETRGVPTDTTQRLLAMYQSGDQAQIQQAEDALEQRRRFGIQAGYVKPQSEKAVYRPATRDEKKRFGVPVDEPYQVSPKGQLTKVGGGGQEIKIDLGNGADSNVFRSQLAKSQVKRYDNVQERAVDAEDQLATLNELEAMEVQQGALEPMKIQLGGLLEGLGVDASKLANVPAGQAYQAQANKMVLGEMQKQKGPQTESDMKLIRKTVAGLGQTPQANKFLIQSAKASALRAVEQRDFMEEYLAREGNLDGASKAWNKYKRDVPMISKHLKTPNGLPMFYYDFEQAAMEENPGLTREQIIKSWKHYDEAAKKQTPPTRTGVQQFEPVPLMMNAQTQQAPVGRPQEVIRPGSLTGRYGQ